jgi:hypothetical protein
MPKSRQRKIIKKKVNVRNKNVEDSKKTRKTKMNFVDNIIKKEQENGKNSIIIL